MSKTLRNIIKAVFARLLIVGHIFGSVWWTTEVTGWTGSQRVWYFVGAVGVVFIETLLCVILKRGKGYKWFSVPICCHLAAVIPCVWFIEWHLFDERLSDSNATSERPQVSYVLPEERWTEVIEQTTLLWIIVIRWLLPNDFLKKDSLSQLLLDNVGTAYDIIEFFDLLKVAHVQQTRLLTVVILSLWTLSMLQFTFNSTAKFAEPTRNPKSSRKRPKRNQVSPEILEITKEISPSAAETANELQEQPGSGSGPTKAANELPEPESRDVLPCVEEPSVSRIIPVHIDDESNTRRRRKPTISSDTIASLISLLMQDGPFLSVRLFLIAYHKLFKYNIVFLTVKNTLVVILTSYRLYSLCCVDNHHEESGESSRHKDA